MGERWLPVAGHWGYEVSDLGRVRCWRRRGRYGGTAEAPRIVKPRPASNGYPRVKLGFKGPERLVHRLVAQAFVPGEAPGLEAAHDNGIRTDCRAANLVWKTRASNHADKVRHGTNGKTLSLQTVRATRAAYRPGSNTQADVARVFHTTQSTVSKVVRGELWKAAS